MQPIFELHILQQQRGNILNYQMEKGKPFYGPGESANLAK